MSSKKEVEKQFKELNPQQRDWQKRIERSLPKEYRLPIRIYKTVFQIVFENTAKDAEGAEARALQQLEKLVGEKEAYKITSRNWPVTTEME